MYSLRRRLLLSATLVLLVFLGVMSLALNRAFENSVLSNAQDTLRSQVLLLMSNVDVTDNVMIVPEVLTESRLAQMDSNLFAQISNSEKGVLWRSPSLLEETLPLMSSVLGEYRFRDDLDWDGKPKIISITLGIEWETEQGDLPFTVQVAEYSAAYTQRLARYQRQFGLWLAILGSVLLVLLLVLLSWAIKPLVKVTKQVGEIEQGTRQRFDEDYPREVSRLTQNLNQLLNFEEQRINQQKEVLGNLAHSLKTPIAVLRGLQYNDTNKATAQEQLGSMQTIIDYQLQSASAVGRRRFSKPIEVKEITQTIINSLNKLHAAKGLNVVMNIDDNVKFYGDKGDWMELVGNLLDNAFKWAESSVSISVKNTESPSHRLAVNLLVSDDGVGIDDSLKSTILQRGVRLDSQTPGHGLGLHIVKGIVEAYNGTLDISDNIDAVNTQDDSGKGTRFIVSLN